MIAAHRSCLRNIDDGAAAFSTAGPRTTAGASRPTRIRKVATGLDHARPHYRPATARGRQGDARDPAARGIKTLFSTAAFSVKDCLVLSCHQLRFTADLAQHGHLVSRASRFTLS